MTLRPASLVPLALLLLALGVAGCGGHGHARVGKTTLTILAVDPNVGRAAFHLSCAPAGGDVPEPARACAALARSPQLVTSPTPFVCHGPAWWDVTIRGRLDGRPVSRHVQTCWTEQMALIGGLGIANGLPRHMLPRRTGRLLPGTRRIFPRGVLRPGDAVVCTVHGRRLVGGVPVAVDGAAEIGYDGLGAEPVSLTVARRRDGTVTAACS